MTKWSVRAYRDGDESKILELWKVVYPKEYDREKAGYAWLGCIPRHWRVE